MNLVNVVKHPTLTLVHLRQPFSQLIRKPMVVWTLLKVLVLLWNEVLLSLPIQSNTVDTSAKKICRMSNSATKVNHVAIWAVITTVVRPKAWRWRYRISKSEINHCWRARHRSQFSNKKRGWKTWPKSQQHIKRKTIWGRRFKWMLPNFLCSDWFAFGELDCPWSASQWFSDVRWRCFCCCCDTEYHYK